MRRGREIDRICDFTVLLMITRTKGQVGALRYQFWNYDRQAAGSSMSTRVPQLPTFPQSARKEQSSWVVAATAIRASDDL